MVCRVPMRSRERGLSLSVFVVMLLPLLLVCAGLVVDGGAQTEAAARASAVAAEAARAGADAGAGHELLGQDPAAPARLAARQVLVRHEMDGDVEVADGAVVVHTRTSAPTTFLSILGITRLHAHGSATARLREG